MTAITTDTFGTRAAPSRGGSEIVRIIRLHTVTPAALFGTPWIILAGAWVVTVLITLIATAAGGGVPGPDAYEGQRYSWAVLAPQWYLVVVGVQAVAATFSFALGFGSTRRDFWIGTSLTFLIVSAMYAAAIATLVQIEIATKGWGLGVHMFDALWYGRTNWLTDAYTTFALQALVLFIGASVTTVYMRWRTRGMLVLGGATTATVLGLVALGVATDTIGGVFAWLGTLDLVGVFSLVLGAALACSVLGFLVIRRATPR